MVMTRQTNGGRPLLLGHRGARGLPRMEAERTGVAERVAAENTLAAFEYALAQGCDGFEFDVRVTRDERLVLCHDASLGGPRVATSSYERLCAGCEETVPCLEEVLAGFGERAYLDIEVKVTGCEELVVKALREKRPRDFMVSSFLPEVLLRLREMDPALRLGYICDRSEDMYGWWELPIQVFLPQCELVSQKLVGDAHGRGLQIFTWTVNRKEDMVRLAGWGVDGLISDDPGLLYRTLRGSRLSGAKPSTYS